MKSKIDGEEIPENIPTITPEMMEETDKEIAKRRDLK